MELSEQKDDLKTSPGSTQLLFLDKQQFVDAAGRCRSVIRNIAYGQPGNARTERSDPEPQKTTPTPAPGVKAAAKWVRWHVDRRRVVVGGIMGSSAVRTAIAQPPALCSRALVVCMGGKPRTRRASDRSRTFLIERSRPRSISQWDRQSEAILGDRECPIDGFAEFNWQRRQEHVLHTVASDPEASRLHVSTTCCRMSPVKTSSTKARPSPLPHAPPTFSIFLRACAPATNTTMTSLKKHPRPMQPHRPLSTLFTLELDSFEPPSSPLGALLWRHRIRFETTLGLSVLEPWEKVLYMLIFMTITTLIATAFYKLLPAQLVWMYHRTLYYFLGSEHPVFAPALGNWTTLRDFGVAHALAAAAKR